MLKYFILIFAYPSLCLASSEFTRNAEMFGEPSASEIASRSQSQLVYRFFFNRSYEYLNTSALAMIRIDLFFPHEAGDMSIQRKIGWMEGMTGSLAIKTIEGDSSSIVLEKEETYDMIKFIAELGYQELFSLNTETSFENISQIMDDNLIYSERIRGSEITQIKRSVNESDPTKEVHRLLNRMFISSLANLANE